MSIKISVGVSETADERERLRELRGQVPVVAPGAAEDPAREARLLGWPMCANPEDDQSAAQSLWAW